MTPTDIAQQSIAKGNKPLGAAFSHGRRVARENGGGDEKARRAANRWLKAQGHAPLGKSVWSRARALSPEERADEALLRAKGISPQVARALAMAGVKKDDVAKSDYAGRYVAAARKALPDALHAKLHATARGSAGGLGSKRAKAARKDLSKAQKMDAARKLRRLANELMEHVDKGSPTISEVTGGVGASPPAAIGPKRRRVAKSLDDALIEAAFAQVSKADEESRDDKGRWTGGLASELGKTKSGKTVFEIRPGNHKTYADFSADDHADAMRLHTGAAKKARGFDAKRSARHEKYADQHRKSGVETARQATADHISRANDRLQSTLSRFGVRKSHQTPQQDGNAKSDGMDAPNVAKYLDAQRLVTGMDHELTQGAANAQEARARASRVLAQSMGAYDNAFRTDIAPNNVGGLKLDLASGQARESGFLGLDLVAYDHGTIVHDLGLGLPFADQTARSIRLVNALDVLPDYVNDATPLLLEVQRVLAVDGIFAYQGPSLKDRVNWSVLPGLQVFDLAEDTDGQLERAKYKRVAVKVPAVYGADPDWLGYDELAPQDLQMALMAYGAGAPADTVMANLLEKPTDWVQVIQPESRVLKADAYQQIVYAVVLEPGVVDSQGDIMTAEEIERTVHQWMIDSRIIGKEHGPTPLKGAQPVESYVAPQDLQFDGGQYGPQSVSKGSWILGTKITDQAEWQKVLDGEYTGYSVGGYGDRLPA